MTLHKLFNRPVWLMTARDGDFFSIIRLFFRLATHLRYTVRETAQFLTLRDREKDLLAIEDLYGFRC